MDGETRTALVLRIFVRESDRVGQRTLWEEILERARRANLAGTMVLRGIAGFGAHSRVHTRKILRLSQTCRW